MTARLAEPGDSDNDLRLAAKLFDSGPGETFLVCTIEYQQEAVVETSCLADTLSALRSGKLDLRAYLERLCDRVEAREPEIHALLPEPDRRGRLLTEAAALLHRFPDPSARPPLFGLPVGVKDIFRVDGFPTHCGSSLPAELFEGPQANVVTALRRAGALVLGKTVTTEFAYFEAGPTRNPRDPAHTPGGSSSGSAAAVAAGYCPLALGSQTVGSVIRPASFCGVVGFKTTYGLVSLEGVIPYSASLDHFGFFVPAAADLFPILSVLLGEPAPPGPSQGVLGVPEGPYLRHASTGMQEAFESWIERLAGAGRRIVRVPALEDIEAVNRRHQRLAAAEMAVAHREWFPLHEALYRPRTAALVREGMSVPESEADAGRESRGILRAKLQGLMDTHGLDAWISPAAAGAAPEGLQSTGDPAMNLPWTHAGLPVVTVPAGTAPNGLPLGLQCAARAGEDMALAGLAAGLAGALEAAP